MPDQLAEFETKIQVVESRPVEAVSSTSIPQDDSVDEFALMVLRGLNDLPRRLDSRFLYDEHGSRIFELICEQPEYYLTRTEAAILAAAAEDITRITGEVTLIELGSGSSTKTQLLLRAYCRRYGSARYAPVDVSKAALEQAERDIAATCSAVRVEALHGTYEEAYPLLETLSPAMVLFLGSTVGNLDAHESAAFWSRISSHLTAGDFCMLGIDINEDPLSLNAAYNDAAGYSQAFTRNIFERMNRELGASLDTSSIIHEARYDPKWRRVEIFARFLEEQELRSRQLGGAFRISAGEHILTEVSRKFRLGQITPYLSTFGLEAQRIFTDGAHRYAVLLLRRS